MDKCDKVSYATKSAAKYQVKNRLRSGKHGKLRIYKCDKCVCYHLTSYTARQLQAFKDWRLTK